MKTCINKHMNIFSTPFVNASFLKLRNLNKTSSLIFAFCLSIASSGASILTDNFDSYTTGTLANSVDWPSAIPDTDNQFWNTAGFGTQAIVDAAGASLGRTGNVYSSTVGVGNSGGAPSRTRLGTGYTGGEWMLSFDFYIDSLTAESATNQFHLMGVYETEGTNNFGSENAITRIYAQESEGTYTLQAVFGNTVGSENSASFGTVNADQWYSLILTGNNTTQTLDFTLSDGVTDVEINNKFYRKNVHEINGFLMGSLSNRVQGTVYIDNFSVVPEPGSALLLGLSAMGFIATTSRKRNRSQKS